MKTIIHSTTREIGVREWDFMLGDPSGDFEPQPMPYTGGRLRPHRVLILPPFVRQHRSPWGWVTLLALAEVAMIGLLLWRLF